MLCRRLVIVVVDYSSVEVLKCSHIVLAPNVVMLIFYNYYYYYRQL
jgi:hypothetical protein